MLLHVFFREKYFSFSSSHTLSPNENCQQSTDISKTKSSRGWFEGENLILAFLISFMKHNYMILEMAKD